MKDEPLITNLPKAGKIVSEVENKALVVIGEKDDKVLLSARNIAAVKTALPGTINVYDIMNAKTLVLTKDAVQKIEEVYA